MRIINYPVLISVICVFALLTSCSLFDPSSPAASYIHIDSIRVKTDYATQGSSSCRVNDAWVIYDNKYLGTFPLPADIPLIGEGSHSISIKGGIIKNGIAASRTSYPKYASFDTIVTLSVKNKVTLSPIVNYLSGVQFPQIEDFDDASLSLVSTPSGIADLQITSIADPNAFEGNSGVVTLSDSASVFEVASSSSFQLPLNTPSYVELNYNNGENLFTIGVFATTVNGIIRTDLVTLNPSHGIWKKIYIELTDGLQSNGIDYKIYLRAVKNSEVTTAKIYFDNLKVVY